MAAPRDWDLDCKVYVGEIGYGAAKQELEDLFSEYGPLKNVWVARNPPGFAFVEFEDHRDAQDAVDALDGARINGRRARVEMSSGKSRWGRGGPPPRRGPRYGGERERRRSRSRSPVGRRRSPSPSVRRRSVSPSLRRRSPSPKRPRRSTSRDRTRRSGSPRDVSPVARNGKSRSRSRSPYADQDD